LRAKQPAFAGMHRTFVNFSAMLPLPDGPALRYNKHHKPSFDPPDLFLYRPKTFR
jgi:hypothetical protein